MALHHMAWHGITDLQRPLDQICNDHWTYVLCQLLGRYLLYMNTCGSRQSAKPASDFVYEAQDDNHQYL